MSMEIAVEAPFELSGEFATAPFLSSLIMPQPPSTASLLPLC